MKKNQTDGSGGQGMECTQTQNRHTAGTESEQALVFLTGPEENPDVYNYNFDFPTYLLIIDSSTHLQPHYLCDGNMLHLM